MNITNVAFVKISENTGNIHNIKNTIKRHAIEYNKLPYSTELETFSQHDLKPFYFTLTPAYLQWTK